MNKQEPSLNRQAASRSSDRMSEAVRAHLENRLRGASATVANFNSEQIKPVSRNQQFPVSFAQEVVFDYLRVNENVQYSPISRCLRISGDLDFQALEKSINELVRRHEILRTRFSLQNDPVQIIDPFRPVRLPIISLEEFSATERTERANQLLIQEQSHWYDATNEPLWRVLLIRLTQQEHLLFFTLDHIITDDWGITILLRDLRIIFGAYMQGKTPPLHDLPIQFADFAFWQRQTLQGKRLEELSDFWRKQLEEKDVWPELHLPFEKFPHSETHLVAKATEQIYLPEWSLTALRNVANTNRATLFMVLLAAFISLLHRYTQQNEIVITTTITNRHRPETIDLVGWLSDQLVFRFEHANLNDFSELLKHVRDVVLEGYQHQDLPYSKFPGCADNWWAKATYPSIRFHMKIFDSSISGPALEEPQGNYPNLLVTPIPVPGLESDNYIKPGMVVSVDQRDSVVEITITYEKARYSKADMAQFAQNFRSIIEAGVSYQG